jgi:hypothetical protein
MVVTKLQDVHKKKKADQDFSWSASDQFMKKSTTTSCGTASITLAACATAYQSQLLAFATRITLVSF